MTDPWEPPTYRIIDELDCGMCDRCGSLVNDPVVHTEWHRNLNETVGLITAALGSLGSNVKQLADALAESIEIQIEGLP